MEVPEDDDLVESEVRIYWDLLASVLSPFLDSLPTHGSESQHDSIPIVVPLIRGMLEVIGSNLIPHLYFSSLPTVVLQDLQGIHQAFDSVLEKLEESVRKDILHLNGELQQVQGAGKFPCLSVLRNLVRLAHITNPGSETGQTGYRPLARDYVVISLNEASLSVLYIRLVSLDTKVSKAFPSILSEAHPTPLDHSIAAAQQAQAFGRVAEALFSTISEQMDEHCKNEHVGSIRVAMFGKPEVDMLLPSCLEKNRLHPTSFLLSAPSQPADSRKLDPRKDKETRICLRIRASSRVREKLGLHYSDKSLWERDHGPKQRLSFEKTSNISLSSFIWGRDEPVDETKAGACTKQDRTELPVLLAHTMLYLYKTRWFQHLWDMDQLFLQMGRERLLQDPYPYLPCVLSMDESRSSITSTFFSNEENCDPLYRHALVCGFGLRLLEIESGKRFPPDLIGDADPELDDEVPLPYITLNRVLQNLEGQGQVEDDYYNIAKACLDFDDKLTKLKKTKVLQDVDPSLWEWVALHNFIFSPLLQLLAKKFTKGAAADLLELELGARTAKSRGIAVSTKSRPVKANVSQLEYNGLSTIPKKRRYVSPERSPLSVVVTAPSMDCIIPKAEKTSPGEQENTRIEDRPSSSATSGGVGLYDDQNDVFDEAVRSYAHDFLSRLDDFRAKNIRPQKDRQRMRIAILDTGIHEEDPYLKTRRRSLMRTREEASGVPRDDPIKAIKPLPGGSAKDNNGHGTQIAGLLTRIVPEADLYIAKISDQMHIKDMCHIADAIDWAVSQKCNIISMSFGMEQSAKYQKGFIEIGEAIDKADRAGILMFAAASNCGGNGSRTYPAWDRRVICVHALDGRGLLSRSLNPSVEGFPDNFGTLGVAIKCFWQSKIVYKTGTSFATPVAAGIAALVLNYMNWSYDMGKVDNERYRTFHTCDGMQQLFRRFMSKEMGNCGYRFVAPWVFWNTGTVADSDVWSRLRTEYLPHA